MQGDRPLELRIRLKLSSGFVTGLVFFFLYLFSILDYNKCCQAAAVVLGPLIWQAVSTCLESPAL